MCGSKRRRLNGPLGDTEADKLPMVLAVRRRLPQWALQVLMAPTHADTSSHELRLHSPRARGSPLQAATTREGAATLVLLHMALWALQHHGGVLHNDVYHNTVVAPLAHAVEFEAKLPDGTGRVRRAVVMVQQGVGWPSVFDFGAIFRGRGAHDALELACKTVIYNADGGEREQRSVQLLVAANQCSGAWEATLGRLLVWAAPLVCVEFI